MQALRAIGKETLSHEEYSAVFSDTGESVRSAVASYGVESDAGNERDVPLTPGDQTLFVWREDRDKIVLPADLCEEWSYWLAKFEWHAVPRVNRFLQQ